MKMKLLYLMAVLLFASCGTEKKSEPMEKAEEKTPSDLLDKYTSFTLDADLSHLSENQKELVKKLIEAADVMNELFWYEAYGEKQDLLSKIDDENAGKKIEELYSSGEFGLIIASDSVRAKLPSKFLSEIEESIEPLVLFMPSQKETTEANEESIAALAKRVLGINIEVS